MDLHLLLNPTSNKVFTLEILLSVVLLEEGQGPDGGFAARTRSGRVSKTIGERFPTNSEFSKPRERAQKNYTRRFKLMVLTWWTHHQVPQGETEPSPGSMRTPFIREVSKRYLVPITTLHDWRKTKDRIIGSARDSRRAQPDEQSCVWPELEVNLYGKYQQRREERKAVRRSWFQRQAKDSFATCYPTKSQEDFCFSTGWFSGFLSRHNITLRFTTNKSQKVPKDYLEVILSWLEFNRRNSQLRPGTLNQPVNPSGGRYLLDSICNMDETPLPFEYLDGQTYADKGSHSVQVRATCSGWDKRQATLVLAVFGSGNAHIQPLIIFRGKERYDTPRSRHLQIKREAEMARYDPRVSVRWNESAYANASILIDWIKEMLVPALPPGPRMLVLDVAKFHSTAEVLNTLRSHDIIPSMVPAGCTGLVQPLDVSVNKPFKDILRDLLEDALDTYEKQHQLSLRELSKSNLVAIAERRILVTWAVGEAWERFCLKHKDLVINTFRKLGLTLPIDGSQDHELSIKGIDPSLLQIENPTSNLQQDEQVLPSTGNEMSFPGGRNMSSPLEAGEADANVEFIDRN